MPHTRMVETFDLVLELHPFIFLFYVFILFF